MSLRVCHLQEDGFPSWDEFVTRHAHGTCFHLTAWLRTIASAFPFQPHYMSVYDGSECLAVAPLFLVDNWMMGRVLLSSPFAVYGGVLATSGEAKQLLREAIIHLGSKLEVQYIELRNHDESQCLGFPRLERYLDYTQAIRPMTGEELLQELPKKTRNMVRKSLKSDFSSRPASNLDGFYDLLSRNYRRLGTPIFPRQFFATLLAEFGPGADVREILLGGRLAAVSLNLLFREQMHTYYAASLFALRQFAPNNFLYYDHLLWAGNNGYTLFDFGRSKVDSGNSDFKRHWNTTIRPLPYEVLLVKRKELPNFNPNNPKFDLAIRLWRLLPLGLTRALGPHLVKLFP